MMRATLVVSMLLAFKGTHPVFLVVDHVTAIIFIPDCLLRVATADLKLKLKRLWAFIVDPFTPMGLIDPISMLSVLGTINGGIKLLCVFRLARTFRVLITVLSLASGYVLIAACSSSTWSRNSSRRSSTPSTGRRSP